MRVYFLARVASLSVTCRSLLPIVVVVVVAAARRDMKIPGAPSTFVVIIAGVVVVAVAHRDEYASGAYPEDLVIDICCCRCRN